MKKSPSVRSELAGSMPSASNSSGIGGVGHGSATGKSSVMPSARVRARAVRRCACGTRAVVSARDPSGLEQHVRARERRVAAEVDLDLGREPAQVERAVAGRGATNAVSECLISAATCCIQRVVAVVEHDAGRVAAERART